MTDRPNHDPFVQAIVPPQLRPVVPWLSLGYYWLLAAVLLVAALAKSIWLDPDERTGLFQIPWLLAAVVAIEVLAAGGLLFLAGQHPALVRRAAMALFALLAAFALYAVVRGQPCQCFGTDAVPPAATLVFDLMAVGLLAILPLPPQARRWSWLTNSALAATVALAVGLAARSYLTAPTTLSASGALPQNAQAVALKPETWIGQRLPIANYVELGGDLNEGEWLLVLYRPDCAHCLRIVPRLRDQFLAASDTSPRRLALVDLSAGQAAGALSDQTPETAPGQATPRVVFGRLQPGRRWIATPPIGILINKGVATRLISPAELETWTNDSPGTSQ
ncbi:MAG: hypothetical protein U0795_05960 [Pirellulales bacterium]